MLASKWKRAMLGIASIGVLSVAANAEVFNNWVDPCGTTLDCLFDFCWCEDQWDTASNWSRGNVPASNETARFNEKNHSNACPNGDGSEDWLQVNLTNSYTISRLRIEVTSGSGNKLRIALVGNATLTYTLSVKVDGTDGPILFEVADGARVKTQ